MGQRPFMDSGDEEVLAYMIMIEEAESRKMKGTFTLEQCWSPGLRFSLKSCVSSLILSPYHTFKNPACQADLDRKLARRECKSSERYDW